MVCLVSKGNCTPRKSGNWELGIENWGLRIGDWEFEQNSCIQHILGGPQNDTPSIVVNFNFFFSVTKRQNIFSSSKIYGIGDWGSRFFVLCYQVGFWPLRNLSILGPDTIYLEIRHQCAENGNFGKSKKSKFSIFCQKNVWPGKIFSEINLLLLYITKNFLVSVSYLMMKWERISLAVFFLDPL